MRSAIDNSVPWYSSCHFHSARQTVCQLSMERNSNHIFQFYLYSQIAAGFIPAPSAGIENDVRIYLWKISGFGDIGQKCYKDLCGIKDDIEDSGVDTFDGWNEKTRNCPVNLKKRNERTMKISEIDNKFRQCKTEKVNMDIEYRGSALRRLLGGLNRAVLASKISPKATDNIDPNHFILSSINSLPYLNKFAHSLVQYYSTNVLKEFIKEHPAANRKRSSVIKPVSEIRNKQ